MKLVSSKSKRKLKPHREKEQTAASSPSDFSFTITKVAVAQVCKSLGFKRTQESALDTLTVVATKYLETVARSAAEYSNAANRTQSNIFDLTTALNEISTVHGGSQGSFALHSGNCLLKSSVLKDLSDFVTSTDEIPFAKPIEKVEETEKSVPKKTERLSKHIPEWLPGFSVIGGQEECKNKAIRVELWENSSTAVPVIEGAGFAVVKKGKSGNSVLSSNFYCSPPSSKSRNFFDRFCSQLGAAGSMPGNLGILMPGNWRRGEA